MMKGESKPWNNTSLNLPPNIILNMFYFLYSMIIGSSVIVFITTGLTDATSIKALIGAYFIILISLTITVLFICSNKNVTQSKLLSLLIIFSPICFSIGFIIYLLFKYSDRISENKVSDYYSTFMNLTNFLLFIQITIILSEISIKSFENFDLPSKILSVLKLFSVLSTVSSITLSIILIYYTTDG